MANELPPSVIERARVTREVRPSVVRISALEEYVDGWLTVDLDLNAQVGEEPLADGTVITDHYVAKPTKFTVEGIVTDHPIIPFSNRNVNVRGHNYTTGQASDDRINECKRAADILMATAQVIVVDTPWGIYPNVVIRSAHLKDHGRGLKVRLQLQALRIVQVPAAPEFQVPALGRTDGVGRGRVSTPVEPVKFGLTGQQWGALGYRQGQPQSHLMTAIQDINQRGGTEALIQLYELNPAEARKFVEQRAEMLADQAAAAAAQG